MPSSYKCLSLNQLILAIPSGGRKISPSYKDTYTDIQMAANKDSLVLICVKIIFTQFLFSEYFLSFFFLWWEPFSWSLYFKGPYEDGGRKFVSQKYREYPGFLSRLRPGAAQGSWGNLLAYIIRGLSLHIWMFPFIKSKTVLFSNVLIFHNINRHFKMNRQGLIFR